jgi:hypothetical protein
VTKGPSWSKALQNESIDRVEECLAHGRSKDIASYQVTEARMCAAELLNITNGISRKESSNVK